MSHAGKTNPTEERQRQRIEEEWDEAHFGTHCVNCVPGDCPIYVLVKDGTVVREEAAGVREQVEPGVPDMNPMICQKGLAWSLEMEAPDRIKYPLRRIGERGEGRWERISWDEALSETADAMLNAIEEIGPESIVLELSPQIAAIGELVAYESLGLCERGESGKLIDEGATKLGGRVPVNTSGGLLRKGHPVGATGIAQIVELTEQLQGRCGKRQVEGATAALAQNGGGVVGNGAASMCVTILTR
jgi:hypothetical protein